MWDEATQKQFATSRILALVLMVGAPIIYLIIAGALTNEQPEPAVIELLFYMLLVLSMVQPAMAFVVERFQLNQFRSRSDTKMSIPQLLFTIGIIKYAMVEAVFIYGLVVFLVGHNLAYMLYFYPIGAVWGFIHWPRRERWEKTIQSLERT
ncbi:MAG: hypothetical protein ABIE70_02155 [bacterium]